MRGLLACLLPMAVAGPLHAQDGPETGTVVIQPENVRMDFAQVMRVKPVYQTLRATRMEPRCPGEPEPAKGLSRVVGAV
jgi:hypothetical protein